MGEQTLCTARDSWLHPHLGATTTGGPAPREYVVALRHVALTLDADPRWRSWWRQSGLSACELGIVAEGPLDHPRPSADIRRLDDRLQANFTCALPARGPAPHEGIELATRTAAGEIRAMFEVIRQALTLPALPPTPPVPSLPADVPDVPVTTKHLPEAPDDPDHLTLAQIQEFFA
ncbi:hypothetical protein Ade02nite_87110 [Paractinoplanes deccanensis]|uniref:Uncharacterized protein n=1 Tax=Paractinoplanes deccanensis TaxID=113561 RepID=A0ABQ3YJS9_9ACTN|nr:hypothetical protein [Actinoplanes deccanensis]GID80070.1 hypothetical protein Ade02nite_87110 [Actinoplanes deccanensis]